MCLFFTTLTLWWGLLNRHFSIFFFLTKKRESAYRPADNLSCVRISRFCKALMSLHLRGAFLCEGRGFSITLGYFINRTAGARFPDLLPPPAVWVCVCVCTWCVWESACMFMSMAKLNGRQPELWENWLTWQNYWWLWWTKNLPTAATVIFSPEKAVCFQLDTEGKGSAFLGAFFCLFFSQVKKGPLDWQRLSYCIIRPGF